MAKVLLESARRHHPQARLYLCLADEPVDGVEHFYPEDCEVVRGDALGVPDFRDLAFRYEVMEFNTALKPFMILHLLARGHGNVIYLDPDIEIFAPLTPVLELLDRGASFVLTPHLTRPAERDAYPDDLGIMRAGVYNLGFLGVGASEETDRILRWWARRLRFECVNEQDRGLFVDQKFMDLVPGFAGGARVLRNTACNVAYWNLHQRELTQSDGNWYVDGEPLCFFHFSGINARDPSRLSKYTLAFQGEQCPPALCSLIAHYVDRLRANGHGTVPNGTYAYARFASGTPIPERVRQMYRDSHLAWCNGDPFESYEEFLHLPSAPRIGSSRHPISHLMRYVHLRDPQLRAMFDLGTSEGVVNYSKWYLRHATTLIRDRRLVEPVAIRIGHADSREVRRKPPAKRTGSEPDVNVIGYLRLALGIGEAGRQLLRAISAAGVGARGLPVQFGSRSTANDHSMDALFDQAALAPIQIFNINADQLPSTLVHLQGVLREDSYRIIMPFWELEEFPQPWLAAFDQVDEVWAPTRFIQSMLTHKLDKPVIHMPLPLGIEQPPPCERAAFGLPDETFLFFFAFDFFSFVERKNPLGLVRAYKKAFGSGAEGSRTKLVIKTLNAEIVPEQSRALRDALRDDPDVIVIERTLSREETLQLVAACDAVVSLHRSEGLGLLLVEAMALGKPVIATDYSATTEFLSSQTGWPVDFDLVRVAEGEYPFHEGQSWARPDENHAAWQMRQVLRNPAEAARRAMAARALLQHEFGAETCAARLLERLDELNHGGVQARGTGR
ncbi:MAG TPA: glycosyltransferase [Dokdonella sp.]|nr:glycosyltransferase [Dokdonella sp.]